MATKRFSSRSRVSPVDDDTIIWFGVHKNKPFGKIPASYLLNVLDGNCEKRIQKYIEENREILEAQVSGQPGVD